MARPVPGGRPGAGDQRKAVFASACARARLRQLQDAANGGATVDVRWRGSMSSFRSRLRWHCQFMQKLEDRPSLEFTTMCDAYVGLRDEQAPDRERLDAWHEGRTGYPLIDACMRSVRRG
ncbi:MAG: FAD-binding domain-containing protein [Gemmatimonadaceae bacterium]|nr:FAD-binding domain-containing protein [Gemmatimonadaceae bacterium]